MNYIYFDSAATTMPSNKIVDLFSEVAANEYANPASMHTFGLAVEKKIETARNIIASTLSANSGEIIFTGSGTEANNLAIFGSVEILKKKGNKIITTDSEHDSVYYPMKKLEQAGFEVVYLTTRNGEVDIDMLKKNLDERVILVSVMQINNETGAVYDVSGIVSAIQASGYKPYIHCDAVQAYGKRRIDLSSLKVDLLTVSAHKIHGLKGVGALYVKNGRRIAPQILGGGQEKGLRSSTLNSAGIITFGEAADEAHKSLEENQRYIEKLYDYTVEKMREINNNADWELIKFNQVGDILKYILSINIPNVRSEIMVNYLSERGICVSSGSACSEKKGRNAESKRVLLNYGLDKYEADFSIRISFSKYNTVEEVEKFISALAEGIQRFRVLM